MTLTKILFHGSGGHHLLYIAMSERLITANKGSIVQLYDVYRSFMPSRYSTVEPVQ